MTLIQRIKKNWASTLVILGIVGGTIYAMNLIDARAADVAKKEVQATVNKEMIDGAKKAAADAVKEQLPEIARQVAKEAAQEVIRQQKEEAEKNKPPR